MENNYHEHQVKLSRIYFDNNDIQEVSSNQIVIFVKNSTGKIYQINVPPTEIVKNLKEKLAKKEGIPVEDQKLIFSGTNMKDNHQLSDYGIELGSTINLTHRSKFKIMTGCLTKSSKKINIYVSDVGNMEATPNELVRNFKERIALKTQIPVENQRLILFENEMDDSLTLWENGVEHCACVVLKKRSSPVPTKKCSSLKDPILIGVQTFSKKKFYFTATSNDTFGNIKEKIFQQSGIPVEYQLLIFNGRYISDSMTLKDSGCTSEFIYTFYLVFDFKDGTQKYPLDQFYVNVKIIGKNRLKIPVTFSETILSLKEKISKQGQVPINGTCNAFSDDVILSDLEDPHLLGEYFIKPNSNIYYFPNSSQSNLIRIKLKTLTGKIIELKASLNELVEDFKVRVALAEGIFPMQQRLIFKGKHMEDENTLEYYHLKNDSLIHLVLRLCGGKPVIYIYPKEKIDVNVKVKIKGEFTCIYPKFNIDDGWNVIADVNGNLICKNDENLIQYDSLFWECLFDENDFKFDQGFVVSREKAAKFLEEKLFYLGLRGKEITSFIQYWLPQMQRSKFAKVKFLSDEYENVAKLEVLPKPDSVIRVFMLMENINHYMELPEQDLNSLHKERSGYSVIEWGGTIANGYF